MISQLGNTHCGTSVWISFGVATLHGAVVTCAWGERVEERHCPLLNQMDAKREGGIKSPQYNSKSIEGVTTGGRNIINPGTRVV